jgi:sodium-dependent phosphate cotransporter
MTVMVQSSSITTSLMVPLVGAGIITLKQFFPYTIGANIGTTVTAMLASLSIGSAAAITVAFSHLLFNVMGFLMVYLPPPVRAIPLALARTMGRLGSRNRVLAALYIVVFFYGLPLLVLFFAESL